MRLSRVNPDTRDLGWPRLLADIGGTNARFGWQDRPDTAIEHVRVLPGAEFDGPVEAIQAYLIQTGLPAPDCAALGMANPVTGDAVQMTNLHWRFSIDEVRAQLGLRALLVLNDFAALALAIPTLDPRCLYPIGEPVPAAHGPRVLIGAGTGLGVSGLLPVPGTEGWLPIQGEGGHVTLAAGDALEYSVIEHLRQRYGHVSAERVLSGTGLVDVYHALLALDGQCGTEVTTPAQVLALGQGAQNPQAARTLELFCGWLGSVAGDLALTLGAVGGVYVGGGIAPRMRQFLMQSGFRSRFETKGRYHYYLQSIPTWLIDAPVSPALEGAARALQMHERGPHHAPVDPAHQNPRNPIQPR
jgi:glucokinase